MKKGHRCCTECGHVDIVQPGSLSKSHHLSKSDIFLMHEEKLHVRASLTLLLLLTSRRCQRLSATPILLVNWRTRVPEPWLIFRLGVPAISSEGGERQRHTERERERGSLLYLNEKILIQICITGKQLNSLA